MATALAKPVPCDRRDGDFAWRTDNVGRLMFAATDRFIRDKLRDGEVALPSEAMLALFLNLDEEGARLTLLASRAGQTKQSMIELVDRAEAMRLVERCADPGDLRAKTVRFTPAGRAMLARLEHGIVAAERRFVGIVGTPFAGEVKRRLCAYLAGSGGGGPVDGPATSAPAPSRQRNTGRLLALSARCFSRDLLRTVHARGHDEVNDVLLAFLRHLDLGGNRLTSLAARARMTKQSMRELVDRAEALSLVERRPEPADRRAKIVTFTPVGLALLAAVRAGAADAEERFVRDVGADFARELRARLADYLRAPGPDDQIVPATGSTGIAAAGFTSANSSTP